MRAILRSAIAVMLITGLSAMAADVPATPLVGWSDVLAMPAVRAAVASLSPADKAVVDEATRTWVQTPLMIRGDGVRYATACRPHLCAAEYVKVVLESDGRARVVVVHGPKSTPAQ